MKFVLIFEETLPTNPLYCWMAAELERVLRGRVKGGKGSGWIWVCAEERRDEKTRKVKYYLIVSL